MHLPLRYLSLATTGLALVRAGPSVTIDAGSLLGTTCSNGASAFLSIPFAVPHVGNLRWTSPQAYTQPFLAGGYNATTKGSVCIKFGSEFTEPERQSEDWLVHIFSMPCQRSKDLSCTLMFGFPKMQLDTLGLPVKV